MIEVTCAAVSKDKKPPIEVSMEYVEKRIICILEKTEDAMARGALISQIPGTDLSYSYRIVCDNLKGANGIMRFMPAPDTMDVLHRLAMQNTRYRFRPYLTMDIQDGHPFMMLTIPATHEMMPGILYPDIRKIVQHQMKTNEVKIAFLAGGSVVIALPETNIGAALYAAVRIYPELEIKLLSKHIYNLDLITGNMQTIQRIPEGKEELSDDGQRNADEEES